MNDARRASDFATLAEMVLDLAGGRDALDAFRCAVLAERMALLGAAARTPPGAFARRFGVTESWCATCARRLTKRIFARPLARPLRDCVDAARKAFAKNGWRVPCGALGPLFDETFGWRGTTALGARRLLAYCGVPLVPSAVEFKWNENGMARGLPPRAKETPPSHRAVLAVVKLAGRKGATLDDVVAECARSFPDANVTMRDAITAVYCFQLKARTRKVDFPFPLVRGGGGGRKSRYAMFSAFADKSTAAVLQSAAEDLRARLAAGGRLSVVDVWPQIAARFPFLPAPIGFYVLLRHQRPKGLSFPHYPWITSV